MPPLLKITLLSLGLLAAVPWGRAQTATVPDLQYFAAVKGITDFAERFNGQRDSLGRGSKAELSPVQRTRAVLRLCDAEKLRNGPPDFRKNALAFAEQWGKQPKLLELFHPQSFAQVAYQADYQGRPAEVTLVMQKRRAANGAYRWIIAAAQADFLQMNERPGQVRGFIPPNSGDVDFVDVGRYLQGLPQPEHLASDDWQYDPTSAFFFLIRQKTLQLKSVKSVTFHLAQFEGWVLLVKEINRPGLNAGYLITDVIPLDTGSKSAYLKNYLPDGR
ncbi:MAG: hypothetical protein MUC97_02315 [Bernardetiaceae bacterium]|jgi:hypothetical protein|nr:hypothetical protein [Bernardetiaceae bacterium]